MGNGISRNFGPLGGHSEAWLVFVGVQNAQLDKQTQGMARARETTHIQQRGNLMRRRILSPKVTSLASGEELPDRKPHEVFGGTVGRWLGAETHYSQGLVVVGGAG